MNFLLLFSLLLSPGTQLEIAGDFVEAGCEYFESNDIQGEARILSRFLEESLYSGNTAHAFDLLLQLEQLPVDPSCMDFWYARLSWNCGLPIFACSSLDSIRGNSWLENRAKGLSAQLRGNGNRAVEYFRVSMECAVTDRQRFYSALDLSFALIQTGYLEDAESIAVFLASNFPGEGLPLISLALCLQEQDRYGEAMSILESMYSGDEYTPIARNFAATLLEDLE